MTTASANAFQALAPRRAPSPAQQLLNKANNGLPPADETEEEKEARLTREAEEVAALGRAIFENGGTGKAASGGDGEANGSIIPEAAAAALMSGNWADTDDEEEQLRQVRKRALRSGGTRGFLAHEAGQVNRRPLASVVDERRKKQKTRPSKLSHLFFFSVRYPSFAFQPKTEN